MRVADGGKDYDAIERRAALIALLNAHRDINAVVVAARAAGISVTDIAHHSGLSRATVHRILRPTSPAPGGAAETEGTSDQT